MLRFNLKRFHYYLNKLLLITIRFYFYIHSFACLSVFVVTPHMMKWVFMKYVDRSWPKEEVYYILGNIQVIFFIETKANLQRFHFQYILNYFAF